MSGTTMLSESRCGIGKRTRPLSRAVWAVGGPSNHIRGSPKALRGSGEADRTASRAIRTPRSGPHRRPVAPVNPDSTAVTRIPDPTTRSQCQLSRCRKSTPPTIQYSFRKPTTASGKPLIAPPRTATPEPTRTHQRQVWAWAVKEAAASSRCAPGCSAEAVASVPGGDGDTVGIVVPPSTYFATGVGSLRRPGRGTGVYRRRRRARGSSGRLRPRLVEPKPDSVV